MPEFQIQRGDDTITVDTDELTPGVLPDGFSVNTPSGAADGFISRRHHDAQVGRAKTEAAKGLVRLEEAASNDQVRNAVLEAHGGDEVDLEAYKKSWHEEHVAPREQKLSSLLGKVKTGVITQAGAELGIKDEYLKGGDSSYLAHVLGGRLEHDDEHGFVATDDEGHRLPGGEGRAFAGAKDLLQKMKASGDHGHLFKEPAKQSGGGSFNGGHAGSGGRSGSGRVWSREEIGKMSPDEYAKHAQDINKAMAEGRIK